MTKTNYTSIITTHGIIKKEKGQTFYIKDNGNIALVDDEKGEIATLIDGEIKEIEKSTIILINNNDQQET